MLPGTDDPVGAGTGGTIMEPWNEPVPTPTYPDRRGILGMGPFSLGPGERTDLVLAYVFARSPSGGALASVAALKARTDSIHAFAQTLPLFSFAEEAGFHGQCVDYPILSVTEQHMPGRLVVFPSPASDQVSFIAPSQLVGGTFVLNDALGRVVLQQAVVPERNTVDIGTLAKGVYICEVTTKEVRLSGRVVKE
jgi:hypothetical protein